MSQLIQPSSPDGIVGSLANKQPQKTGAMGQYLIGAGVVVAVIGLIMRLTARSQISEARLIGGMTKAIEDATTLGNVGLAFLIIGGALAFLGVATIIVRR